MKHGVGMLGIAVWTALSAGCVERRFVVNSDPPGALVLHNGKPMGAAPADDHFIYYGYHEFTLIKDGYETLKVQQKVPAPWYQWFPLDIFSEVFVPLRIEDVRRFNYALSPVQAVRPDELVGHAQVLRERGKAIQPPAAPDGVPPPAAPGVMPFLAAPVPPTPSTPPVPPTLGTLRPAGN